MAVESTIKARTAKVQTKVQKLPTLKQAQQRKWEDLLAFHLQTHGLGDLFTREVIVPEFGRKWRWDFADLKNKVLLEVQGGIFAPTRMAHSSGVGIMRDHEKNNAATFHGYHVFQFSDRTITDLTAVDILVRFYRDQLPSFGF
jgi:very-short-patch-repair endonuclease